MNYIFQINFKAINMIDRPYSGYLFTIVCMITLFGITQSNLSVYNLQSLGQKNEAFKNIKYSVANFGFAPLGKTLIGRLSQSPKFSNQCDVQETNEKNKTNYQNSFMLIPRGQCQFVFKAINAQKLGVQMAIIMDDSKHENMLIMADNGYGYKVKIPSIFINYQDGQRLKELLEDNPDSSIMMKMVFQNTKVEKVDVNFYIQSYNRHSNRLIQNFANYIPILQKHINLNLIHSVIDCPRCKEDDCYFDKKYCAENLINQQSQAANGKLILDQQIRQQIIYQNHPQGFWTYMSLLNQKCVKLVQLKECSQIAMQFAGVNKQQVEKAFKKSFEENKGDNSYLKSNKASLYLSGIQKFPSVTLNGLKVKGSLNGQYIFDDICNLLLNPPKQCQKFVKTNQFQYQISSEFPTLVLVIVIGIIIFSVIFVVYRRYMKRKISSEMQGRVDDMVSKYVQFYSQRSRNK